jgi:hypothetical protein
MSQVSKNELKFQNSVSFPNNNSGEISPADLRNFNVELIDSTVNQTLYTQDSSSFDGRISSNTIQINNINAFTASVVQEITSLESFTSSQEGINTAQQVTNTTLTNEINELLIASTSFEDKFDVISLQSGSWGADTGSYLTTGSNNFVGDQTITGSLNVSGSITASIQEGFALVGGVGDISTLVATSSFGAGSGFPFTGDAQITGSLGVSGATTIGGELSVTPALLPNTFPAGGTAQFIIPVLSGSSNIFAKDIDNALYWSPAFNQLAVSSSTGNTNITPGTMGLNSSTTGSVSLSTTIIRHNYGNGRNISIAAFPEATMLPGLTGITNPSIIIQSGSVPVGVAFYAPIQFESSQSFTDGRVTITRPLVGLQGAQITGNSVITGSLIISSSENVDLGIVGIIRVTGSLDGQNVAVGNTSISVNSGSTNGGITALGVNFGNGGSIQNRIALYSNPTLANSGISSTNPSIIVNKSTPPFPVHAVEFIDGATISLKLPTQITGSLTISGSSAVDLTVVGNQTVSGSVLVSGSVTQRFNAPAENTATELAIVNGVSVDTTPYNVTQFTFSDLDYGVNIYRDAFLIESWDSTNFAFGSEFVLNGKNVLLNSFASGSVSGDNRGGQIGLFDQGNGKTKAILTGQNIEIGGVGKAAFNSLISETITIGRSGIETVISGSVDISGSLSINNDIFVSSSDIFLTGSGASFINIFQPSPGEQSSAIRFYSGSTIDEIGRGGQIRTSGNGNSINIGAFGAGETTLVDFDFQNLQTNFSQNVNVLGSKTLTVSGTGSGEFSSIGPRGTISLSSGSSDIVFSAANPLANTINRAGTTDPILIDIYNVESTLSISITATGSFIQDFSAVTNVNENAIKLQPYSDYQRGQVTILRDLDVSGSTFVSGSVRGNVASASISSNTASLDFGSSNFFTLTLVSGSSTHIVPQNVGTGQTINLKVVQPSVGVGTISFPSSFKFPEVAPYTASIVTSSVDVVTFITFEDTGSIYSVAVKRLV